MNRAALHTTLALTLTLVAATSAPADERASFPADAAAPGAEALHARLAGQVFRTTDAKGLAWRLEYSRLGHLFVDIGTGFQDDGPYRVEGSQVCVTLRRSGSSCSEYRLHQDAVYLRRASNGEILKLNPQ